MVPLLISSEIRGAPKNPMMLVKIIPNVQKNKGNVITIAIKEAA